MAGIIRIAAMAVALAPLLSACVIYDSSGGDDVSVQVGRQTALASGAALETLGGVRFEGGGVVIRVGSNGCTSTSDFAVEVTEDDSVDLTFTREAPDLCKALVPDGVELSWTYAELGLTPGKAVVVRNPVRLP